jgi:hypothetical protein
VGSASEHLASFIQEVLRKPDLISVQRRCTWLFPKGFVRARADQIGEFSITLITLGVYALLRPSEILGSAQHRDRTLRFDQIEFFETASSTQRVRLHPIGSDADDHALPDRYSISLGVTKTDQRAKKSGKIVAGAPTVEALWRGCHLKACVRRSGVNLRYSSHVRAPRPWPAQL